MIIPEKLEATREAARNAIGIIQPANQKTEADPEFLMTAQETEASKGLPDQYLIYFLLVELLGFRDLGKSEKISWSVPIDYEGRAFLIEHRKFGVGIFAHDAGSEEEKAQEILRLILNRVNASRPFFDWLAEETVNVSKVNVYNKSRPLLDRFSFLLGAYKQKVKEAEDRKDEVTVVEKSIHDQGFTLYHKPYFRLRQEARWLGLSTIEAFFSWTEHILIHLALLSGRVTTAKDVADLAAAEWSIKFKTALDISDATTKGFYDTLLEIRRQIRNFLAHGAFGKQGEAFEFHSRAGAVPVLLPHRDELKYSLNRELSIKENDAIDEIERFINHLWTGPRAPAELYIQQSGLPIILTMVKDGTYASAMNSTEDMNEFIEYLSYQFDQAANMDW